MINTERKYVQSLETLQNVYLHALEHVVAPRDLRLLFPAQLEPLIEKHTHLLEKLEERVSKSSCFPGIVGDVFSRLLKDSNVSWSCTYSYGWQLQHVTVPILVWVYHHCSLTWFGNSPNSEWLVEHGPLVWPCLFVCTRISSQPVTGSRQLLRLTHTHIPFQSSNFYIVPDSISHILTHAWPNNFLYLNSSLWMMTILYFHKNSGFL